MTENYKFVLSMFKTSLQNRESYELAKSFLNKQEREFFLSKVKRTDDGRFYL